MRIEFSPFQTLPKAEQDMPWAYKIVRISGGYLGFARKSDFNFWQSRCKGNARRAEFLNCKTAKEAQEAMPWAFIVQRKAGGFRGYDRITEYLEAQLAEYPEQFPQKGESTCDKK